MKITEIRGFNLSFPLKEPIGNSLTYFRKRDAFLVQIVTDAGLSGWGESGNSPDASSTHKKRHARASPAISTTMSARSWPACRSP
mgnify:CR=1 FL=1